MARLGAWSNVGISSVVVLYAKEEELKEKVWTKRELRKQKAGTWGGDGGNYGAG
jgi:hypothetical protein